MRDLAEAGRLVVESPAAPPTPVEQIESRAHGRRRRGRARAAAALIVVVALVGGAVVVAQARRSGPGVVADNNQHSPQPATLDPEMRAHLGVGVPKGWVPVDYGDARLWVPPTWKQGIAGLCPEPSGTWIATGVSGLQSLCGRTGPGQTAPAVVMTDLRTGPSNGAETQTINSYATFTNPGEGRTRITAVPALHVSISIASPSYERILATLGPSSRAVALRAPAEPVPSDWRRVSYAGLSIAVPGDWPVRFVANSACTQFSASEAQVGRPRPGFCNKGPTGPPDNHPQDGAWLTRGPVANVGLKAVSEISAAGLKVRAVDPGGRLLDVVVNFDNHVTSIEIGLGRDGRVANAILHSIASAPKGGFGVEGCTPRPLIFTDPMSTLHQPIVPANPESALLCGYAGGHVGRPFTLVGAASPDAIETAHALDAAREPGVDDSRCPQSPPFAGTLHLNYSDGRSPVLAVDSCGLTLSASGNVVTPSIVSDAMQSITPP